MVRNTNGQSRTYDWNDIESMAELQVSFMPDKLVDSLTDREFRDLAEFLEGGSELP